MLYFKKNENTIGDDLQSIRDVLFSMDVSKHDFQNLFL